MDQQERIDLIEEYGRGFSLLQAALAGLSPAALAFKPAPTDWSVHEVILHLADSELIGVTRLNMLIAQPGTTLMPYDEAKWAAALRYGEQSMDDALQLFKLLRQRTYPLLKTLPERQFRNSVVHPENAHPEFGAAYTVDKWLQIYAWHVRDHNQQLHNNVKAWKAAGQPSG